VFTGTPERPELIRRLQGFAGALTGESRVDEAVLRACPDLKVIVFLGTGASSYIDVEACSRHAVMVRNVSGYGDRVVAEHAAALMFAAYRDLGTQHFAMRSGGWDEARPIGELRGKVLGVVGLGAIGCEMALIGEALGMKVIGWSRQASSASCQQVELNRLLETADVVSLHLALTNETRRFLDRAALRRMKRGAVLINTARGGLIDEDEVAAMLADGHLAGAGLDVYQTEPLPADHKLRSSPNVVLSCHSGWQSPEAVERLVSTGLARLAEELQNLS
jgi:D-3-phosphoglycerate dehydrogenase